MMFGYNYGWFSMSLMMVGMTLWIALLVILVWAIFRYLSPRLKRLGFLASGSFKTENTEQLSTAKMTDAKTNA
jgi:hypothetical protein